MQTDLDINGYEIKKAKLGGNLNMNNHLINNIKTPSFSDTNSAVNVNYVNNKLTVHDTSIKNYAEQQDAILKTYVNNNFVLSRNPQFRGNIKYEWI